MPVLVLIHGRSQQNKDPAALKTEWLDALEDGLLRAGFANARVPDDLARFVYYGQLLGDVEDGKERPAGLVVRHGHAVDLAPMVDSISISQGGVPTLETELLELAAERLKHFLPPEAGPSGLLAPGDSRVATRGVANWEWVQAVLRAADRYVPWMSELTIRMVFSDVQRYIGDAQFKAGLLAAAIERLGGLTEPIVVVSRSLGTAVAHDLLNDERCSNWKVPLWVTLGSPLRIRHVQASLGEIRFPSCVSHWMNAYDERDVIALHQVDFSPPPEKTFSEINTIRNRSRNHHGIAGYLRDRVVADSIGRALGLK